MSHWLQMDCVPIPGFIGRTDAEAPILGPPDVKNRLIGKTGKLTHWKDSRCWERLKAGEGGNKG